MAKIDPETISLYAAGRFESDLYALVAYRAREEMPGYWAAIKTTRKRRKAIRFARSLNEETR